MFSTSLPLALIHHILSNCESNVGIDDPKISEELVDNVLTLKARHTQTTKFSVHRHVKLKLLNAVTALFTTKKIIAKENTRL